MSLRARLTLVVVAVVAVAVVSLAFVTRTALASFLDDEVHAQVERATDAAFRPRPVRGPQALNIDVPAGTYAQVIDPNGRVIQTIQFVDPDLYTNVQPAELSDSFLAQVERRGESSITVSSEGTRYRVHAAVRADGYVLVVAIPLASFDATMRNLDRVLVLVSIVVVIACAAASFLLVSFGLRPLRRMATTADQIAGGDLTARVEPADDHSEIGNLGSSLNSMLDQLSQNITERDEANRRLRRFVADASHELRTPLTSIRGYAELFRRGASEHPEDLEVVMRRIEDESARMGVLVDDLLLLARLDQGLPLERGTVGLAQLVDDCVRDASVAAPDHEFEVAHAEPVMIEGDDARLRQVVMNLLRNAALHTPSGTAVSVTLTKDETDAVLAVADQGPGIPAADRVRIFERFARTDESRARETGGTGLGLAIAHGIVVAHHGHIDVSETPGGGATFTVRIPLVFRE